MERKMDEKLMRRRKIRWVMLRGMILFALVIGYYFENQGALNIGLFLVFANSILAILAIWNKGISEELIETISKNGITFSINVNVAYYMIILSILLYNGAIISGIVWFIHIICMFYFYSMPKQQIR